MKRSISLITLFFTFSISIQAQSLLVKNINKVQTLNSTILTLYAVISGEKGQERDWELMKFLFHPEAKLIPSGKNKEGVYGARDMTPDDYILSNGQWLVDEGFFEKEIHRTVNTFGNITQVFSTYESYHSEVDEKPFMRGINSIQLLNDGQRWWVLNVYWSQESEENQSPKEYLPK